MTILMPIRTSLWRSKWLSEVITPHLSETFYLIAWWTSRLLRLNKVENSTRADLSITLVDCIKNDPRLHVLYPCHMDQNFCHCHIPDRHLGVFQVLSSYNAVLQIKFILHLILNLGFTTSVCCGKGLCGKGDNIQSQWWGHRLYDNRRGSHSLTGTYLYPIARSGLLMIWINLTSSCVSFIPCNKWGNSVSKCSGHFIL